MSTDLFVRIRRILAAPVFKDEEKTQAASLLNLIVWGLLVLSVPYSVAMLFSPQDTASTLLIVGFVDGLELVVLLLLRRGSVRLAGWAQCLFLWLIIDAALWTSGGIASSGAIGYTIVIIMAGLLLGPLPGAIMTLLSILSGLALVLAEMNDLLPPLPGPVPPLEVWVTHAAVYLMMGLLLHLALRSIRQGALQARCNEKSLQESNRQLQEVRVELEQRNTQLRVAVQQYVEFMTGVVQGHLKDRLSIEAEGSSHDPLVMLGHNLNDSVASLQQMIGQIRATSGRLGAAAGQILSAVTQLASGAGEQSAAIAQASSNIDEVRTIAEQTAQRAQTVARLAQQTAQVAQTGQHAVAGTVTGMEEVKRKVDSIAHDVLALSEQAQAIGGIISTVGQIANQSNMLALNASVEAARAGDAGKGFAVVAQEVRSLAQQSKGATEQVREILTEIQRGVNTAVMATEEGIKGAEAGLRLTGDAGRAIQDLFESVETSTQSAQQIAAAAAQQQAGMEQMAQVMDNILQVTTQSSVGARQVEGAAQELDELARQLWLLVEEYEL